jgi:acyl carrier protein
MRREEIQLRIIQILEDEFEIENPGADDNLREVHGFDSIDAITLLTEIEKLLGKKISQEDKKRAMDIRTINHICDYIESLQ